MSKTIAIPTHPSHRRVPKPPWGASPLERVRRLGYVVLGLQLAFFLAWSVALFNRFAVTPDFAQYQQAWFMIAHGTLSPFDSVQSTPFPFWQNHSEFIMWPLAPLYWLWPHGPVLLWVQDIGVVAAETVAFAWMCEIAQSRWPGKEGAFLAATGLTLLAVNTWTWWSISFDFHAESLALTFVVLLGWDLANDRRRAWVWVVPLLACGDVAGTYLAGMGMGVMLFRPNSRRRGALLAVLGVGAVLFITVIHGNIGSGHGLKAYGYLASDGVQASSLTLPLIVKGIASHPLRVLTTLWSKRIDILANLAPSGLLGLAFPLLLPLMLVVLLADTLFHGLGFAEPVFQNLPIYVLLPVGTIAVLSWLMRRHRRTALVLSGVVAVQAISWATVWGPQTRGEWLRVPPSTAATLASVQARIPESSEVIASQGVVGRFAGRYYVRALELPGTVRVSGDTWFVICPVGGVEEQTTNAAMALMAELAGPLHATLITHSNGVWVFRMHAPVGLHAVNVPRAATMLPAWTSPGSAGHDVVTGREADWHVTSSGGKGYVGGGLAWQEPIGHYQASVTLSATGPVNVEVWNDNGSVLLARRSVPMTNGVESISMPVDANVAYRASIFSGWGPFRAVFIPPIPGQRLEVRVWSPGGETVNVYRASLTRVGY